MLAAATVAGGVFAYTAASAQSSPSAEPPVSLSRPVLHRVGRADERVRIVSRAGSWRSPAGVPVRLRFSWLECDLEGRHCSPLPGLDTRAIVAPQELRIVTLRGVVTATNLAGSTSVTTRNVVYDMAGLAFDSGDRRFLHQHPQYDPAQLRAWYGLAAEQNGAGQTIVIPAVGSQRRLRGAVDHFSEHYGLPRTCRNAARQDCFQLVITRVGRPTEVNRSDEAEADVEWAHAVAPDAKIVVLRFDFGRLAALLDRIGGLGRAGRMSVVSDSWCDPCTGSQAFGRHVVYPHVERACHLPHLVCVQATGNHRSPGAPPSNSPYLLAAGGTMFRASPDGAARSEIPWPPSGFGDTDIPIRRPTWQRNVHAGCRASGVFSCKKRAVPDVSATAANVPVFRPVRSGFDWSYFHGTSLSTPLWAGLIAVTDQALESEGRPPVGIDELHQVLYRGYAAGGLDDIRPHGWDWATGLGSPKAGIVDALTRAIERYRGHS